MTTPTGIEEKLHDRADYELKKAVEAIIKNCNNELNQVLPGNYATHGYVRLKDNDSVISRTAQSLLDNIGSAMIEAGTAESRENVVKEFMEKVDTLHEQIDELRDEIQYN